MTAIFSTLTKQVPDNLELADRWQKRAACRTEDPELFFPVGEGASAQQQAAEAKAVCYRCPVVDACLNWAMTHGQDAGVWGGLDERERHNLRRRQLRAARTPGDTEAPIPFSRPRTDQPRTPASVYAENTEDLADGHTAWVTCKATAIGDQKYTPMQLAWVAAYGTRPIGRLHAACGQPGCVTPSHLMDHGANKCGSRPGYQTHLRRGEVACTPCLEANRDADMRLRNTGTTKLNPERSAA